MKFCDCGKLIPSEEAEIFSKCVKCRLDDSDEFRDSINARKESENAN